MAPPRLTFDELFRRVTGYGAFPYQRRLATGERLPQLLRVPTGAGKTAAVVLAWLWRRRFADAVIRETTPRRLVYCLPMRVLVEQTSDAAREWLRRLEFDDVRVHVLMGGEERDDWDLYPERDAIIVGTQDMLLSRALNRGYAMSRYRWPIHFALLNKDALWILDEVQLMGSGLATTAQLAAFRSEAKGLGAREMTRSIWMSATLHRDWLRTVDLDPDALTGPLELEADDLQGSVLAARYRAVKQLARAGAAADEPGALAKEVVSAHRPGTRTLVVLNTVDRAQRLAKELRRRLEDVSEPPEIVLIHSRFRPRDRARQAQRLLADPGGAGTVIVATQVVEAGVDVSAKTLFTELAPWASLVQRFGRCNRVGEFAATDPGRVYWIDLDGLDSDEKRAIKAAAPYPPEQLREARNQLTTLEGRSVGPETLDGLAMDLPCEHLHVLRRKDLVELFDTTPDLAGNDLDIDRYVRDVEDTDVRVFWRDLGGEAPQPEEPLPNRDELCPAPIGKFRNFVDDLRATRKGHVRVRLAYRRNFLERTWQPASAVAIAPGQVYLLDCSAGGYDSETGWTGEVARTAADRVAPVTDERDARVTADDGHEADVLSRTDRWQTVGEHTEEVCAELEQILGGLETEFAAALRVAARWHDWGKAHAVFQHALPHGAPDAGRAWAKAPGKLNWKRYERRQFRHELASALALLALAPDTLELTGSGGAGNLSAGPDAFAAEHLRDLAAYLVAAHHGKVRLSIRSLPTEMHPPGGRRFARGIWDGDALPATDLGGGVLAPPVTLSLEPMELGLCREPPFAGQPSWAERMLRLRDRLGPFRLAYLEALLRAADMRASASAAART